MTITEQVLASTIAAGDIIIRDGEQRTVVAVDQTIPRQTAVTMAGGGNFTVGKRSKIERWVGDPDKPAAPDAAVLTAEQLEHGTDGTPAPPAVTVTVPSPRTVALSELQPGDFVRWHMLPHRVDEVRPVSPVGGGEQQWFVDLEPWLIGGTLARPTAGPFTAEARFVTLTDPDRIEPAAAVETMRPTAANVGRAPAADAALVAEADAAQGIERHDDGSATVNGIYVGPPTIPDFVQRANATDGPVDVAAAGQAIRDRGGPLEQVRPGSALGSVAILPPVVAPPTPTAAVGGSTTVNIPVVEVVHDIEVPPFSLVVEVFRSAITAAVYDNSPRQVDVTADPANDRPVVLIDEEPPMHDDDALELHRDTLDAVDRMLDERPGWYAVGPWSVDASGGFLLVFTRDVRQVEQ